MRKVIVSSPGKLLISGEHAVIYGYPCIVTAVDQRLHVSVQKTDTDYLEISAPQVSLLDYKKRLKDLGVDSPKAARFVEVAVVNFFQAHKISSGLRVETKSDFSAKFGFGSSSAATVGTLKALSELFGLHLNQKQLFDLSYKTVLDIQGVGSGFDIAAAIFGGTLFYIVGGKKIRVLTEEKLPLVVGYTGIKADTPTLVREVAKLREKHPKLVGGVFAQMGDLVEEAEKTLIKKDFKTLGELMDTNHGLLDSIGVNTIELSKLIFAARSAGAYGAKLSGAGGGDCMIALCPGNKMISVKKAIKRAGGIPIDVETGAEGAHFEKI